ncbi:hypothetical protein DRN43_00615 [Thermococci archaeon]|nr:MAG: hypothetical protein DRN43_00615 [Thermococci archaeon]
MSEEKPIPPWPRRGEGPLFDGKEIGRILFILEDPSGRIGSMHITFKDGSEKKLYWDDLAVVLARILNDMGIDPAMALTREYTVDVESEI